MKAKATVKKLTALAASLVITATSIGASFSAYADSHELPIVPVVSTPKKFDLRNVNGMNYVTPVKNQVLYETCWSFAANAAAETNILYANGMGVKAGTENNNLDFSEKHTAWYSYARITDKDVCKGVIPASQIGEGHFDSKDAGNGDEVYQKKGTTRIAFKSFANGVGPVKENESYDGAEPFRYSGANQWVFPNYEAEGEELPAEGFFVFSILSEQFPEYSQEQFWNDWADKEKRTNTIALIAANLSKHYAIYDNWSLPDGKQYRLSNQAAVLKQFRVLEETNSYDPINGLQYNEDALETIKKEISSGHALTAKIYTTAERETVMNEDNWAQYIGKDIGDESSDFSANHGVTVVGYDDDYPKENFARDNDNDGKTDEGSVPPKNGAFIIKNSYGCITAEDEATAITHTDGTKEYTRPGAEPYGIDNSGYFYVSYYDLSLEEFTVADFFKQKEQKAPNTDQYDLMAAQITAPIGKEKSRFANIFTAEQDEYLSEIGLYTYTSNTKAEYSIYKNPTSCDPTSGTLLESGTKIFSELGYYRFDLKNRYLINAGDKYAIVVKYTAQADDELVEAAAIPVGTDTAQGIINSGESVFEVNGQWVDLADRKDYVCQSVYASLLSELGEAAAKETFPEGAASVKIDNFSVKGYTTPAAVRFAGANRYDTAAKISSQSGLFEKSDTVIIASGEEFADALAGVPLAAAYNAPILLSAKKMITAETAAEIKRLGASKAIILGGTGAVSEKAEAAIKQAGCGTIERIAGATRFDTAVKIAQALAKKTGKAAGEVFFVVYNNFADALSASTAAAIKGAAIIYVPQKTDIDKYTAEYLSQVKGDITGAYVIGGEGVIPEKIRSSVSKLLGGKTAERIAGANRYETCVEVNKRFADVLTGSNICIAKGLDFPDALAGGVYAALTKSPMLLADKALTADEIEYLKGSNAKTVVVFGGTGAVSDSIVSQAYRYLKNA